MHKLTDPQRQPSANQTTENYLYAVRDAIGLKATEKSVAMILVAHRNHKTGQCNLSYETIATKTGFKRSAVIRAITALSCMGLITKKARKTTAGDQTSNQYDFHLEAWLFFAGYGEGGVPHTPPGVSHTPPGVPHTPPGVPHTPPGCTTYTRSYSLSSSEVKSEEKETDILVFSSKEKSVYGLAGLSMKERLEAAMGGKKQGATHQTRNPLTDRLRR